jgi:hypothetical protein
MDEVLAATATNANDSAATIAALEKRLADVEAWMQSFTPGTV